ncbi:hypothetical protein UFOVP704_48 [uncultured Caudovirales phage]|uniref:Uncharacterized protein n=1 Tax=uncultured Caudovirales phage TaxID=2100421 RepID=A0A6J5NV06_9CAUD|nr:hypothetical protein UFOVP704_48 [uncultured Caudovirales phage]
MAKFNTFFPFGPSDYTYALRTIQTASGTSGFTYVFICPADFANGASFRIAIQCASNTNNGGENVSARLYAISIQTGVGVWNSAAPLSGTANIDNDVGTMPPGEIVQFTMTLTSALTKGERYAVRIFPSITFGAGCGFNAAYATNTAYSLNADEYGVNGVTPAAGYPNISIGSSTIWYPNKCSRALPQTTSATSAVTSQTGFRFSLPTGFNYTLNEIVIKGLRLSAAAQTTGTYTGRILDAAGTTTVASSLSYGHGLQRVGTQTVSNYSFNFTTNPTLTGGTTYFFVVENAFEKTLQYFHIQNTTDSSQTFNEEVLSMDVVSRDATSGAFLSFSTASYQALPFAHIDATPVATASGSGMVVHPGMKGGING